MSVPDAFVEWRPTAKRVDVAECQRDFATMKIEKQVYSTAWGGTVVLEANRNGGIAFATDD